MQGILICSKWSLTPYFWTLPGTQNIGVTNPLQCLAQFYLLRREEKGMKKYPNPNPLSQGWCECKVLCLSWMTLGKRSLLPLGKRGWVPGHKATPQGHGQEAGFPQCSTRGRLRTAWALQQGLPTALFLPHVHLPPTNNSNHHHHHHHVKQNKITKPEVNNRGRFPNGKIFADQASFLQLGQWRRLPRGPDQGQLNAFPAPMRHREGKR